jgi:RHS repeat-associated protein
LDSLGRTFLTEDDNKDPGGLYRTRIELDVSGNTRAVIDARANRTVHGQMFDMLGQMLFAISADAGWSRTLFDIAGSPVRGWDARGHTQRFAYDALRRPMLFFVRTKDGPEALIGRCVYGEAHPEAIARNLRTRMFQVYDGAGVATSARFDFDGNLVVANRRLASAYRETPDWSRIGALQDITAIEEVAHTLLDRATFTTTAAYDALGRVVSRVTPDRSETRPTYNEASLLERVDVRVRGSAKWTTSVEGITYDARGDRTRIVRGNGTTTSYAYDAETFRLTHLVTVRGGSAPLQNLRYEHDPVGNIVQTADSVSFGNPEVPADGLYAYDPLYRLTSAEGREHPSQQPSFADAELVNLAHPHDLQALRRYREAYAYDPVGNILEMAHRPLHATAAGWVRRYGYAEDNNRLLRTSGPHDVPGALSERYTYDPAGNMTAMPHLAAMRWDYANQLAHVDREGGGKVYFTYDAGGERVRKVYEHSGLVEERIYLGGYEIYRKRRKDGEHLAFERETLHVMDGARRVALIETTTLDEETPAFEAASRTRYELDNHLGSAVLEVDEAGEVISYEEYMPFGVTALRAGRHGGGFWPKRYRYTGKERDDETGLYYHGARYYAAWLGRWTAVDPLGIGGPSSVYAYVDGNPLVFVDPDGMKAEELPIPDNAVTEYEDPDYPDLPSGYHDDAGNQWAWDDDQLSFVQTAWGEGGDTFSDERSFDGDHAGPTWRPSLRRDDPNWVAPDQSFGTGQEDANVVAERRAQQGAAAVVALNPHGNVHVDHTDEAMAIADVAVQVAMLLFPEARATAETAQAGKLAAGELPALNASGAGASGEVALDANALIGMFNRGEQAAIETALGARTPVVPPTAAKEFLRGARTARSVADRLARGAQLRSWLVAKGGRIGAFASESDVIGSQIFAGRAGRVLRTGDARVMLSAEQEGLGIMTRDEKFIRVLKFFGISVVNY